MTHANFNKQSKIFLATQKALTSKNLKTQSQAKKLFRMINVE